MPKIDHNNPQIAAIKNQYLEAQKNKNTTEMNQLRVKGMALVKEIEKNETQEGIKNKDGDLLNISPEGAKEQEKTVVNNKVTLK